MKSPAPTLPPNSGAHRHPAPRAGRAGPLLATCLGTLAAHAAVLDFEDLTDGGSVGATYAVQGVTFDGATARTASISLNELEFPPASGLNVVEGDVLPVTGVFSTPVSSLSAYFTYVSPIIIRGFDAAHVEVASESSAFGENFVSSGNAPNELLSLSFPGGIYSFSIETDPAGGSFVFDDFTFAPVPEASSTALVAALLGGFALLRRR